ncbi:homoprotocatechuate degradation operon regulator HpaR [Variovorax sp. PCZ-1]|uniref:homoprotocatechuate degradation operon regulator HpaR n=1 Tax=Variovorax sp. PCZ-1 TaxID=2835533 RepID=UPI001BCF3399|nr:homoprotocatechuate degradation operon regulator HpaR [Variovorax sp. PCZ-1]MBS7808827.1 homoprotocatechuate degradation operon regulator HpaR [Variovorax sp. PCZ-1]
MNPFAHRNLPRLLLQARETVLEHFRPGLREHSLTDQQWRVLRVLAEEGECDVSTIAQGAFLLGPSLSGVLTRMERDGLIVRAADSQDARRQVIRASAKGKRLVVKLSESIEAHYARMETSLGKARLLQLYALLDEVIAMPVPAAEPLPTARKRAKP